MRSPFPWYGGKSRAAALVWSRLGSSTHYVEPFAGSLAVLLARASRPVAETANDMDATLVNFWRATRAAPDEVAAHCDYPISELDLHARNIEIIKTTAERKKHMLEDPRWYDAEMAGWWVWGVSQWLGGEFGRKDYRRRPNIKPHTHGGGVHASTRDTPALLRALSQRLRKVRICCGDWRRVLTSAVLIPKDGTAGVLLDPPYSGDLRARHLYAEDSPAVAADVQDWCAEHGDHPQLRIALCGLAGEHAALESRGWSCVGWTAGGGYTAPGKRGDRNRRRERIWFSPHCLSAPLFRLLEEAS